jgi:hypothetical protein
VLPAALLHADSTAAILIHVSSSKADVIKAAIHELFFCVSICNSLPVKQVNWFLQYCCMSDAAK